MQTFRIPADYILCISESYRHDSISIPPEMLICVHLLKKTREYKHIGNFHKKLRKYLIYRAGVIACNYLGLPVVE